MGRFKAILRMIAESVFVNIESWWPTEAWLADVRAQDAQMFKKMVGKADTFEQQAVLLSQQLAAIKIRMKNAMDAAKAYAQNAREYRESGDERRAAVEEQKARAQAEHAASYEAQAQQMEDYVNQAFSESAQLRGLVLDTADRLEEAAARDAMLVMREQSAEIRVMMDEMRREAVAMIPGDREHDRARIETRIQKKEAMATARAKMTDALVERSQTGIVRRTTAQSVRGDELFQQISQEVGLTRPMAAAQSTVVDEATQQTLHTEA